MSALTAKDITKIARLARIEIAEPDISKHADDLSKIIDFVAQINSINTDGITPMAHSQDVNQRLRPDEINEINQRELLQSIAPQTENGLYLVPKVINLDEGSA